MHGSVDSITSQQARMLSPRLYRLYISWYQNVANPLSNAYYTGQPRRSFVSQPGTSVSSNAKLSERYLLIIRRSVRGCQELKRVAEACCATTVIEIISQLSDMIGGMNLAETQKPLNLTKLPYDVEFHKNEWLREKVAEEQGQRRNLQLRKRKRASGLLEGNVSTEVRSRLKVSVTMRRMRE